MQKKTIFIYMYSILYCFFRAHGGPKKGDVHKFMMILVFLKMLSFIYFRRNLCD